MRTYVYSDKTIKKFERYRELYPQFKSLSNHTLRYTVERLKCRNIEDIKNKFRQGVVLSYVESDVVFEISRFINEPIYKSAKIENYEYWDYSNHKKCSYNRGIYTYFIQSDLIPNNATVVLPKQSVDIEYKQKRLAYYEKQIARLKAELNQYEGIVGK